MRSGWVNVDMSPDRPSTFDPATGTASVTWDLRSGLPFPDTCAGYIYSSHFWEHLTADEGVGLFREALRVARPGAVFRVALPDGLRVIRAWFGHEPRYLDLLRDPNRAMQALPGRQDDLDFLNYLVFQQYEHKLIYSPSKVISILEHVGFVGAIEVEFDAEVDVNLDLRRRYSFYVQATRAGGGA